MIFFGGKGRIVTDNVSGYSEWINGRCVTEDGKGKE
jgi:hypothetical protein